MSIFAFLSLQSALFSIIVGSFVLFLNIKERLNRLCFRYAFYCFTWAFCEFCYRLPVSEQSARFWMNVGSVAWPFVMATFMHLAVEFTGRFSSLRRSMGKTFHLMFYGPATIILAVFLFFPDLYSIDVKQEWWGWTYTAPGIFRKAAYLWGGLGTLFGVTVFARSYFLLRDTRKGTHNLYIGAGLAIPCLLGFSSEVVIPLFGLGSFPEMTNSGTALTMILIALGIRNTGLFSIEPAQAAGNIVEAMSEALFLVDNELIVRRMNRPAEVLLGYSQTQLVGYTILPILDDPSFLTKMKRPLSGETTLITKDGRRIPVLLSVSSVRDRTGTIIGTAVVARDESERLRIQAQLVHSEKLASLGTLAAGVGHEINNPLAVMLVTIELLREERKTGVKDESRLEKSFDKMEKAGQRISQIVQSLRLYARSNSEDFIFTDVHAVIHESLSLISEIYKKQGAEIRLDLQSCSPFIMGNRGQLQQVVINLLSNAFDATVGRSDRKITLSTLNEGPHFILQCEDNGAGMSKETLRRIFDPFFTTKEPGHGTGLGLPIVQSIISNMKGTIKAESQIGKGSVFSVCIPSVTSQQKKTDLPSPSRTSTERPDANGLRVLIVDDEPDVRELLIPMIEAVGATTTYVDSGSRAIELLKIQDFDCVITDMTMPQMTGGELIQLAKELFNDGRKRPYFAVLTGNVVEANPFADITIFKPFRSADIHRVLTQATKQKK